MRFEWPGRGHYCSIVGLWAAKHIEVESIIVSII